MLRRIVSCRQNIFIRGSTANLRKRFKRILCGNAEIQDKFERIFLNNEWKGEESLSGTGSSLDQTAEIRAALPRLIADLRCETILDAPCGDFNWMSKVRLDVEYFGCDVVEALVAFNQKKYGSGRMHFIAADITKDRLPKVDLVLSRDCLVHLSYGDAFRALNNILDSGARYLLTTTFPARKKNTQIVTGDWRPLNLELPPFCFPPPLRLINEKCSEDDGIYEDKSLGLWDLKVF